MQVGLLGMLCFLGCDYTLSEADSILKCAPEDNGPWSALGTFFEGREVTALTSDATALYAAYRGDGGPGIARWDGLRWLDMGRVFFQNGTITELAMSEEGVLVAGSFAWDNATGSVARWDGQDWRFLGDGLQGRATDLVVQGRNVYAVGSIHPAGEARRYFVAHWDGERWGFIEARFDNKVLALAVDETDLYVGGTFTAIGVAKIRYLARRPLNGGAWSAVWPAADRGFVEFLHVQDSLLYVDLAMLNTHTGTWKVDIPRPSYLSDHGSELAELHAMEVSDRGDIYLGGFFKYPSENITHWHSGASSLLPMGCGVDTVDRTQSRVLALEQRGDVLYVGGAFERAGGQPAPSVAAWRIR